MKKLIPSLSFVVVASMLFAACSKDLKTNPQEIIATNLQIQSDDQARVAAEVDAVADDANVILNHPDFAGYGMNTPVSTNSINNAICDASVVVDTASNPRTMTVTYNGTNCFGNRSRTGSVVISMAKGIQWGNTGAQITVTFNNVKVKRMSDNKTLTLNGTQTITNTSGGRIINLPQGITITHTINSTNMSLTFDNGMQRTWSVAKQRVFTYNNGIVVTATGLHTDGTHDGIAEWGNNRFGIPFASAVTQPIVVKQDCSFRVVSGQVTHYRADITTTATFGLDATGNATSCPGTGKYYLKLVWADNVNSYTVILPY
jgi:hypothetical protein